MNIEKYNPNSLSVGAILGLIASGEIAIPEIQRPFVWKKTQVRDLLDSLYKGVPHRIFDYLEEPKCKVERRFCICRQEDTYRWTTACYCAYDRHCWNTCCKRRLQERAD